MAQYYVFIIKHEVKDIKHYDSACIFALLCSTLTTSIVW